MADGEAPDGRSKTRWRRRHSAVDRVVWPRGEAPEAGLSPDSGAGKAPLIGD